MAYASEAPEVPVEEEAARHDSQRPTFRVGASAGVASYAEGAPRIDEVEPRSPESLAEMLAALDRDTAVDSPPVAEEPVVALRLTERSAETSTPVEELPRDVRPPTRSTLLPPPSTAPAIAPVVIGTAPVVRTDTLRVRLTPYAREHAAADGDTDDTPAEMLRYHRLLGSFDRVPYVTASMQDVMVAKLDHKEGFVLSRVDGASDIDAILDACPMPTHKTLRILHALYQRKIVGIR